MKRMITTACAAMIAFTTPAFAEFAKINSRSDFVSAVNGKTLTRPFVKLRISPNGNISGKGAAWDVMGEWSWQGGFLCRSLFWGGDDMGYNCQEVKVDGAKMRITSDKGAGRSADFRLR